MSILDTFNTPPNPSHPGEVEAEAPDLEQESKEEVEDVSADAQDVDDQPVEEAADVEPEGDTEEAEETVSEPDDTQTQYVESDAKTRLRDGTEITIGELKKLADGTEVRTRMAEVESQRTQIAQQTEHFRNTLEQAIAVVSAKLPPAPSADMLQEGSDKYDPIGYMQQKQLRDNAVVELNQLTQARSQQLQQEQQSATQEQEAYFDQQQELAAKVIPELGKPETAAAFVKMLKDAPTHYPNMPKDIPTRISSAWEMEVLRDALHWKDLQASKAKVREKVKDVPPVQPAGRRVSTNEAGKESLRTDLSELRKTGDRRLGESILSRFS